MIKSALYKGIVTALLTSTLAACGGGSSSDKDNTTTDKPDTAANKAPVIAELAPLTAMERDTITVTANASDEDGTVETLQWEQTSGSAVELENNDGDMLTFRAPDIDETTTLTFKLTATDDKGKSSSQELTVTLNAYEPLSTLTISDDALANCLSDTHKDVGIAVVECADYPITTLSGLSGITSLTSISVTNAELTDLAELANIPTLRNLKLDNAFAAVEYGANNNNYIEQINALTKLESLSISESQEENSNKRVNFSMLDLSGFSQLHTLEVQNYNSRSEQILLSQLPSDKLTHLTLRAVQIDDQSTLKRFSNLQSVSLTYISDLESLSFLNAMPNLTELTLERVDAADSSAIEAKTNLTTLVLDKTQIEDFSFLKSFSKLQKLGLGTYGGNTDFDIADISNNVELNALSLRNLRVDNASTLSTFTELHSLALEQLSISSLRFLQTMPELTSLELKHLSNINDLGWISFTPSLTELHIRGLDNSVDFSVLSELENMRDLTLHNRGSQLSLSTLGKMSALEKLTVLVERLTASSDVKFPNVKTLDVSAYHYSNLINLSSFPASESAVLIQRDHYEDQKIMNLDALGSNSNLKSLRLEGFSDVENISQISEFKSLESLYISETQVTDISAVASLPQLKWLTLNNFYAFFRADMLANLSNLESLTILYSAVYCDDQSLLASLGGVNTFFSNDNCIKKPVDFSLVTDDAFKQCLEWQGYKDALRTTSISCHQNSIESLNGITQFEALRSLDLGGSVNSSLLQDPNLAQLNTLQLLDINGLMGELTAKATLPPSLSHFKLTAYNQEIYDFALLDLPTTLSSLHLDSTKLKNYGSIKNYVNLTHLNLSYTGISDLSPLFDLHNLQYFRLYGNPSVDCDQFNDLKKALNISNMHGNCN
ncbi:leucine-rich repeat domain-containing protein [Pseudoalteromonas piscicida]|uniref:leucine-rich repeat domain-containing protein n=1 Tax=Pseudoalteromonas piscicida TaxID=43662 RepID=UPI0030979385